jgi:hypothetical protein
VSQKNDRPRRLPLAGKPSPDISFIESERNKKNADHAKKKSG